MPATHLSETFRPVPGFPNYRVSNLGYVQSFSPGNKRKKLPPRWRTLRGSRCGPSGHLLVRLYRKGHPLAARYVHALVLELFVGPCPPGMESCHFPDRDPGNNRVDNLRWDTHRNNLADRIAHGTLNSGERNGGAKLTEADVREIVRLRGEGHLQQAVADRFNVSRSVVSNIERGKAWKYLRQRDSGLARTVMEQLG